MRFEIKKFQSMRTDDGGGYSFDLYMDGKLAAFVCQEGNGGSTMVRWSDQKHGASELEKQFDAYVDALPAEALAADAQEWEKELYPDGKIKVDADTFLAQLADEYELTKRFKRMCKSKTLFRLPEDGKEHYRTVKQPFTPELKAKILARHPGATFINEEVA